MNPTAQPLHGLPAPRGQWRVIPHDDKGTLEVHDDNGALCSCISKHARLIAATPELLEACRRALAEMEHHDCSGVTLFLDITTSLRSAIAKATGQS